MAPARVVRAMRMATGQSWTQDQNGLWQSGYPQWIGVPRAEDFVNDLSPLVRHMDDSAQEELRGKWSASDGAQEKECRGREWSGVGAGGVW